MKRHTSLEPFSRDHNVGLNLARRLSREGSVAFPELRDAWRSELQDHFREEERLLLPLCDEDSRERLLREHAQIAQLAEEGETDAEARLVGDLLHDHIRWEERELFVALEHRCSEATLRSLGQFAVAIEGKRENPLRAEQVARRAAPTAEPPMADLLLLSLLATQSGPHWGMETEDLNATLLVWRQGEGIALHVNAEVDVLIVVLEGEAEVTVAEEVYRLGAGQTVAVRKGLARSLTAVSDRCAHLNVHARRRKLMPGPR
jgi:mannose-6-phosphate isomerase-like protein (cupin superfamily)